MHNYFYNYFFITSLSCFYLRRILWFIFSINLFLKQKKKITIYCNFLIFNIIYFITLYIIHYVHTHTQQNFKLKFFLIKFLKLFWEYCIFYIFLCKITKNLLLLLWWELRSFQSLLSVSYFLWYLGQRKYKELLMRSFCGFYSKMRIFKKAEVLLQ